MIKVGFTNSHCRSFIQTLENDKHIDIATLTFTSVYPYNIPSCHVPIPAVLSQNVTNKKCLVCDMNETYAFLAPEVHEMRIS